MSALVPNTRFASGFISLCLLLSVGGCADLKQLQELQRGLIEELGTSAVNVNLTNGRNLTIMLVNSPLADQGCETQAAAAQRAANFVRTHYPRFDSLRVVAVGFTHQRRFGVVSTTATSVPFSFSVPDIRNGALAADSARGVAQCLVRARLADQSAKLD